MSRQSRIQAQKRNEFRQLQQVNRLYAQNLQAGMTPAPAATSQGSQQVTLTDGQSLDALAQQNGVGVTDILKANPDMTAPKTGMVLNIPSNYNTAQRGRGYSPFSQTNGTKDDVYGGGLPSNAALGGLSSQTTNQVPSNYNSHRGGLGFDQPSVISGTFSVPGGLSQNQRTAASNFQPPTTLAGQFPTGGFNVPGGLSANQRTAIQTAAVAQPQVSAAAIKNSTNAFAPTFRTKDDYYPTELAARVNLLGLNPTQEQLNYLEKTGMITKTPQPAYAGGGGFRGRGGRGRGGGGFQPRRGGGGGGGQSERLPAFSSGAGFGALVNWRI